MVITKLIALPISMNNLLELSVKIVTRWIRPRQHDHVNFLVPGKITQSGRDESELKSESREEKRAGEARRSRRADGGGRHEQRSRDVMDCCSVWRTGMRSKTYPTIQVSLMSKIKLYKNSIMRKCRCFGKI